VKKIAARIESFRKRILPARNKLIGHLDLNAALGRKSLGGASIAAWRRFWLDLQDFLTIHAQRYLDPGAPFYLSGVGMLSDADQLIKALKEASYFRAILADETLTGRVTAAAFNSRYHDV
jgi:hypothetical protein